MKKFEFDLQRFAGGVLTYDPKKVIVIFGNNPVTGFSEDTLITLNPHGEGMQLYVGADGEVGRSTDPDETFTVTLHLASTSKSNTDLSNAYNTDRATAQYIQPLLIKDLSGQTLFSAGEAWVANFPEATKGRTIETQDWEIQTGKVKNPIIGGNN